MQEVSQTGDDSIFPDGMSNPPSNILLTFDVCFYAYSQLPTWITIIRITIIRTHCIVKEQWNSAALLCVHLLYLYASVPCVCNVYVVCMCVYVSKD